MWLFFMCALLLGAGLSIPALFAIKWRIQARTWIRTKGKIVDHPEIERERRTPFPAALAAAYSVNGQHYHCEDIDPGGFDYLNYFSAIGLHKPRILNTDFAYGSDVYVYYDPANPGQSCLRRASILGPSLGVLLCFAPSALIGLLLLMS